MFRGLVKTVHFIGIGGIGMSAIAEVLIHQGFKVTGSDLADSKVVRHLVSLGAEIHLGHAKENLGRADVVVVTSAVHSDNAELVAAKELGLPIVHRSEMLADLMRYKYGVCVAGTHGKTTITSLISNLLVAADMDPTAIVGGVVHGLGTNGRYGHGDYLVAEADESDGSFLRLFPTLAVISNIEAEHLDHYTGGMAQIRQAFIDFANKVPFYGKVIACLDNAEVAGVLAAVKPQVITYGMVSAADWQARNVRQECGQMVYDLYHHDELVTAMKLNLLGQHNVLNSLAVVAVAAELAIPLVTVEKMFASFQGVGRRLELKGEVSGITIIDDYGHHPTEIRTTIEALKKAYPIRRLVVAFQPHRYSRTRDHLAQFAQAFGAADKLYLTEIYAASEDPIPGINGRLLADEVVKNGHQDVTFIAQNSDLEEQLIRDLQPGDILLTLGAGNLFKVGESILTRLMG